MTLLTLLVGAGLSMTPAQDSLCSTDFSVPFAVGEKLEYNVHFGPIKAGEGTMEVVAREQVRGQEAWRTRFRVRGGVPFYRVDDVLESWIDVDCFHSLRFVQDYEEGGRVRERRYEIFPERSVFVEGDNPEQPSVAQPLDDGSFFYFIRTQELVVGESYEYQRYFRPDRNPVIVRVIGKERIKVPAGTFNTIIVQPIIKTRGIFSDKGEARIWLSDDKHRIMVQMKSKLSFGSLNLYLKSFRPATTTPTTPPSPADTGRR